MTNTFILTWNPSLWPWPPEELDREVMETAAGRTVDGQWAVGARRRGIAIGDRALLLRQHTERGLVASGKFTSEIFWGPHWADPKHQTTYATIEWDAVVHAEHRLPTEELKTRVPEIAWDRIQGSGVRVPDGAAKALESLWEEHLGEAPVGEPDEPKDAEVFVEGGVTPVMANRYERDRKARQRCIEHWGTDCSVCGFSFEAVYGPLGKGYVQVHHLRELSSIGRTYVVDPVADLRPVCPNCHAMLHQRRPALSIAALRKRLRG